MGSLCSKQQEDQTTTETISSSPSPDHSLKPPPSPTQQKTVKVQKATKGRLDPDRVKQKRVAVAADTPDDEVVVNIPDVPKTTKQRAIIEQAVNGNILFDMLSASAKAAIIDSMTQSTVADGSAIITQGETEAKKFYVLEEGQCDVYKSVDNKPPKKVHTYNPGTGFGELALLYNAPRAATVQAVGHCRLWVMDRSVYVSVKQIFDRKAIEEKRKLVDNVPLFQPLSDDHKTILADALELVDFEQRTIVTEGEIGDRFYLIKEGRVNVMKNDATVDKLTVGDYFGERALVKADIRAATVVANGHVSLYTITREAFNKELGPIETVWRYAVLKKVPVFFSLTEQQLWKLADSLKTESFSKGELVIKKGDEGDNFYIIEEGTFSVFDDDKAELARVGKGSCFGELALIKKDVRAANVAAVTDGKCLTLNREQFNQLLGALSQIQQLWRFEALRRVPVLAKLTPEQRSKLCSAFEQKSAKAGQDIVKQGEDGKRFYIVESGILGVFKDDGDKPLAKLGPTCYFGELALLKNETRAATVRALTAVTVLSLDREEFNKLLGPLVTILKTQATSYGESDDDSVKEKIEMSQLKELGILGTGGFGRVVLVTPGDDNYYALKCMSKTNILESGLQDHVIREREIMMELQSPFLVNLRTTFKDKYNIYMLMESIMGGELFTYLQSRRRPLNEDHARFYAASVICAFEYMHNKHIIYRDLKPENLLIDTNGYVRVTDFGFAKKMVLGGKTYTLCGTPEYLAPELITQTGHTHTADWWALGILLYEFVAGQPPFYDEDRVRMFKKICDIRYICPPTMSQELRDLIRRLLVRKPAMRLGAQKGAGSIKAHEWFKDFSWESFEAQKLSAPYVPKVKHPGDMSNFVTPPDAHSHPATQRPKRYVSTGVFKDF